MSSALDFDAIRDARRTNVSDPGPPVTVGEPLDGRRQGRGHRIADRHRGDIVLRIHP